MKSYNELMDFHFETGYFKKSDSRYRYELSPEPFFLTQNLKIQVDEIGCMVKYYLSGLRSLMKGIQESNDHTKVLLRNSITNALCGLPYIETQKEIPVVKVDVMIDASGNLKVAEIDAYNPRGMIFAAFQRDVHQGSSLGTFFPGITNILLDELTKRNSDSLLWCYAHHERFYERAFSQLKRLLGREGIKITLCDMEISNTKGLKDWKVANLVPWGMRFGNELYAKELLLSIYKDNEDSFLYPLVPWLGNKVGMGIVSNPTNNQNIESLVQEHFASIDSMRKYIPKTVLASKRISGDARSFLEGKETIVLKANVSSGMKGVWIHGLSEGVPTMIGNTLKEKNCNYTLQECVDQKQFSLNSYDPITEELKEDKWFLRMTIFVKANGEVADIVITGRRTPDVHGANDCIQMPCVY